MDLQHCLLSQFTLEQLSHLIAMELKLTPPILAPRPQMAADQTTTMTATSLSHCQAAPTQAKLTLAKLTSAMATLVPISPSKISELDSEQHYYQECPPEVVH